jgi:hypothetical protein
LNNPSQQNEIGVFHISVTVKTKDSAIAPLLEGIFNALLEHVKGQASLCV